MKFFWLFLLFVLVCSLNARATGPGRFFYEGDGKIAFMKGGQVVPIHYRKKDATYLQTALNQINEVFGMPSAQLGENVSLRTIAVLDFLQDRFTPGKALELLSGYRSPALNDGLRKKGGLAAKTSYHMDGMAADVIFSGVDSKTVWEYVKSLNCCGVGMYNGKSVHVDSGKPRFWTAETALPKKEEPPENRNIYLSVDKDIYYPEEKVQLFFSGISDYPFGVRVPFRLKEKGKTIHTFKPKFFHASELLDGDCVDVRQRKEARQIFWTIPFTFKPASNLSVEVSFCNEHFSKMPKEITSRVFAVH